MTNDQFKKAQKLEKRKRDIEWQLSQFEEKETFKTQFFEYYSLSPSIVEDFRTEGLDDLKDQLKQLNEEFSRL